MCDKRVRFKKRTGQVAFPIFNRTVLYFIMPYFIRGRKKSGGNINRTVRLGTAAARTHYMFIVPVYSNYIAFYCK